VELCTKITKKMEEKWGFGGDWVFGEKGEKWGNGQPAMGGGGVEVPRMVVGKMMGGSGVWIIGRLDEEG
jgi:hypothetical protein